VGGWFGWKPSRPCVRQIRARRRPSAASNGWLADAHHREYMHQVFMISSKKCFDPAVRFWSVCLFKFFFPSEHTHTPSASTTTGTKLSLGFKFFTTLKRKFHVQQLLIFYHALLIMATN
jgi:hypothetical protein